MIHCAWPISELFLNLRSLIPQESTVSFQEKYQVLEIYLIFKLYICLLERREVKQSDAQRNSANFKMGRNN
jgi:hypothetical protein